MTYVNERGMLSSGPSWQLSRLPDMVWSFFNVVYLFFRSLLEPALNIGSNQSSGGSRSGSGRGPPRPPRGGFGSMSSIDSPGSFPPMGG